MKQPGFIQATERFFFFFLMCNTQSFSIWSLCTLCNQLFGTNIMKFKDFEQPPESVIELSSTYFSSGVQSP